MTSSLLLPIADTNERRSLFKAATLDYPSSDQDLLEPGHVDFVLYLSEVWKPSRLKESRAMPISKGLALAILVLGACLVGLGVHAIGNAPVLQMSAPQLAEFSGYGLLAIGGLLLLIMARLVFRFMVELLELIH